MDDAFWRLLFSTILLVIMVLLRPSANSQRSEGILARAFNLPSDVGCRGAAPMFLANNKDRK